MIDKYINEGNEIRIRPFYDIETKSDEGRPVGVVLSHLDAEYRHIIKRFDTLQEMWGYYKHTVQKAAKNGQKKYVSYLRTLWAHNGNNFDHLLLYQMLEEEDVIEQCEPMMNDGRLIGMDIKVKGVGSIHFRDTWRLLPRKADDLMSTFLGTGKTEGVNPKDAWKLKESDPELFWTYCENDVVGMQQVLVKFEHLLAEKLNYTADLPYTTPGIAMRLWRSLFADGQELWTPNSKKQIEYEHKAYHGGLTLALHTGIFENVTGNDVNSMYPFVMRNNEFPDDYAVVWDTKVDESRCGIWRVIYKAQNTNYPPIVFNIDGKVAYSGEAYITTVEYSELMLLNYNVQVIDGFNYLSQDNIYKEYVDLVYELKRDAGKTNKALAEVAKLLLNSLYGKKAERSEKTHIYALTLDVLPHILDNKLCRVIGPFVVEWVFEQPKHQFYGIAAHVTAYARLTLHRMMRQLMDNGIKVLYCDTDSVYYVGDNIFEDTDELGGLKKEFYGTMKIAGKKLYSLRSNEMKDGQLIEITKIKAKGIGRAIKQGVLNDETFNTLMDGESVKLTFETLPSPRDVLFLGKKAAIDTLKTRTIRRMKGIYDEILPGKSGNALQ